MPTRVCISGFRLKACTGIGYRAHAAPPAQRTAIAASLQSPCLQAAHCAPPALCPRLRQRCPMTSPLFWCAKPCGSPRDGHAGGVRTQPACGPSRLGKSISVRRCPHKTALASQITSAIALRAIDDRQRWPEADQKEARRRVCRGCPSGEPDANCMRGGEVRALNMAGHGIALYLWGSRITVSELLVPHGVRHRKRYLEQQVARPSGDR